MTRPNFVDFKKVAIQMNTLCITENKVSPHLFLLALLFNRQEGSWKVNVSDVITELTASACLQA